MNTPVIFDGRNCYEINDVEEKAIEYYSVGRKAILNLKEDAKSEAAMAIV